MLTCVFVAGGVEMSGSIQNFFSQLDDVGEGKEPTGAPVNRTFLSAFDIRKN